MSTVTHSNWSGNKKSEPDPLNRQQQTKQIEDGAIRLYPEFVQDHLNVLVTNPKAATPKDLTKTIAESTKVQKLCQAYKKSRDACSPELYDDLAALLNCLSEEIHSKLPSRQDEKIVFLDYHSHQLDHHPRFSDTLVFPDIIAVLASTKAQYDQRDAEYCAAWHHLLSVVEEKSVDDRRSGSLQEGTYLAYACQARPDIAAMYGISFSPAGYRVLYNDASGIDHSPEFGLEDLKPLACYVYSLYRPPESHHTRDTSITLSSRLSEEPRWNVEFKERTYRNCKVKFVGAPHKRQTWIAVCEEPLAVVKDSWWTYGRNWVEAELFDVLHEDGTNPVPGWVQICSEGKVPIKGKLGYLSTYAKDMKDVRKLKRRIIMSTYGDSLSRCGSVLNFLKAMYDILEAHRFAATARNILHRDISRDNILVNPKGPQPPPLAGPRPKFIHEIVEGKEHASPVAVLCDLDNGCELNREDPKSPTFKAMKNVPQSENDYRNPQRTGTPMYVARSLCEARFLLNVDYEPMPPIPESIYERYLHAHTYDPPRRIRFLNDDGTYHGASKSDELYRKIKQEQFKKHENRSPFYLTLFFHRMRHDAESVYWVIVTFLLLAKPRLQKPEELLTRVEEDQEESLALAADDELDTHQRELGDLWSAFSSHKIEETTQAVKGVKSDSRSSVLDYGPDAWRDVLHAKLGGMAEMLFELSLQVKPEYVYLIPDLDTMYPDHLHEAIQRILLKYMLPMWHTDGIPLYKGIHRVIPVPVTTVEYRESDGWNRTAKGQSRPGTRGSKRSEDSRDDGSHASKRLRGHDGSADKATSYEAEGSRASRTSGKSRGSRGSKSGQYPSSASTSTTVMKTRSQSSK